MKKEEAIKIAKDFLRDAKLLVSIEPTEKDVQALEILINEVEIKEELGKLSTDKLVKELMRREGTLTINI